jgi:hypothetical protein
MWLLIAFIFCNTTLGWYLFESAWKASKLHREVVEERDQHFPAWRRLDVNNWKRNELMPLAVTILPLRIICFVMSLAAINIAHFFLFLGCEPSKPLPLTRRKIGKVVFTV